jgi:hypothetical protein
VHLHDLAKAMQIHLREDMQRVGQYDLACSMP